MRLSEAGQKVQEALQGLSPDERAQVVWRGLVILAGQIAAAAPTQALESRANTQAALTQEVTEKLITSAGGIFLGEKQLKELGIIDQNVSIPPVPEKFSSAFLNAAHPLRGGKIAEHIIVGFDPETQEWCCFEKSIIPGSLGHGLSGPRQDELLLDQNGVQIKVEGLQYTSPTNYRPIKSVLDNVIRLALRSGGNVKDLPFYRVYGRTADTENLLRGNRVLLGGSSWDGSSVDWSLSGYACLSNIGLLAGWN